MAILKITSKLEGLAPAEAADYAKRYRYKDSGPRIDGDSYSREDFPFDRRVLITPDGKLWTVDEGETAFSDDRTRGIVKSWEKRYAIEQRKAREGWKGDIRLKKDGSEGPEYDRFMFSLSKDEAAQLGPDGTRRAFDDFVNSLRESPYGGQRLIEVEPVHTDTDYLHIHVTVHRHGYDVASKLVSRTVWQPEIHGKEAERIVGAITAPITVDYVAPGSSSRVSEEARQGAAEAIREAGGAPSPELSGQGRHAERWNLPDPEASRIESAIRESERRVAEMQEMMQREASRIADLQNSLSVFRQKAELETQLAAEREQTATLTTQLEETQQAAAEAAERAATELAEQRAEADRLARDLDTATTTAAQRAERISELEETVAAEPERLEAAREAAAEAVRGELEPQIAAATERAEAAERQSADLAERISELEETVAAEPERLEAAREAAAEAVRGELEPQIAAATERAEAAERQSAELADRLAVIEHEIRGLRETVETERRARQAADQAREAVERSIPDRIREAISEARQTWEREVVGPLKERVADLVDNNRTLREAVDALRGRKPGPEAPAPAAGRRYSADELRAAFTDAIASDQRYSELQGVQRAAVDRARENLIKRGALDGSDSPESFVDRARRGDLDVSAYTRKPK